MLPIECLGKSTCPVTASIKTWPGFERLTIGQERIRLTAMKPTVLCLLAVAVFPSVSRAQAQVPVFEIDHADSSVKFDVKASVAIEGTFDKWDASVTLTSPELATAVMDIKIQADSVHTGSGMKDGKLKGKDFFDAEHDPLITFHSTKVNADRSHHG